MSTRRETQFGDSSSPQCSVPAFVQYWRNSLAGLGIALASQELLALFSNSDFPDNNHLAIRHRVVLADERVIFSNDFSIHADPASFLQSPQSSCQYRFRENNPF